jgi:hypothetical protein
MATASELFEQGHRRIRLPQWAHPQAYLRFTEVVSAQSSGYGPWLRLFDPTQEVLDIPVGSQQVPVWSAAGDEWEPYTGDPLPQEAEYTTVVRLGGDQ